MQEMEERFLINVKDHEMKVIRDDGFDRHLQFRKKGTPCYGFEIITWFGHLLISGDCGTYVFRRVEDMFRFFRMNENDFRRKPEKKLLINPGYWSEKVLASPSGSHGHSDIEEYSEDKFAKIIKEYFEEYYQDKTQEKRDEIWEQIQSVVFHESEFEAVAIRNAMNFRDSDGNCPFQDFWEVSCREYTHSFIWNLYAIVWGIQQYDESKSEVVA